DLTTSRSTVKQRRRAVRYILIVSLDAGAAMEPQSITRFLNMAILSLPEPQLKTLSIIMFSDKIAIRSILTLLLIFFSGFSHAQSDPAPWTTGRVAYQASNGQVRVPLEACTTCSTTRIWTTAGLTQTVILPPIPSPTVQTTLPANINGQPRVVVVGPSDYISLLPSNVILVDDTVITANPTGFRVGSQEVGVGEEPVTIDGEVIFFGSEGLFVDGIRKTFANGPAASSGQQGEPDGPQQTLSPGGFITVAGSTVRPAATGFEVFGTPVEPGGPAVTVSGNTLSLGPGILVSDGTTIALPQGTNQGPASANVPTTTPADAPGEASQTPAAGSALQQISVLNATESDGPSTTTLIQDGQTQVFARETFSDLTDLTTTTTVRTSVSNDGSGWITGVPVVVFPDGWWWHGGLIIGGIIGAGGGGGFCLWPFCPPGGPPGGGGSSGDAKPKPGNPEDDPEDNPEDKPEDEDDEPEESQEVTQTEEATKTDQSTTAEPSTTRQSSQTVYPTLTLEGDPVPDLNQADMEAWGSTVYARMVANGFGEDVTNIG
ncbi:MAG: hypothetical protein Q9174_006775, partial [Haloplaca sp. 1 TL-2023]